MYICSQSSTQRRRATEEIEPADHALLVTLDVDNVSLSDAGQYRLGALNIGGDSYTYFHLEVHPYELTTSPWTDEPTPSSAPPSAQGACALVAVMLVEMACIWLH